MVEHKSTGRLKVYDILCILDDGEVPFKYELARDFVERHKQREIMTTKYNMWALVDLVWTKKLADELEGMKCLEIAAGSGWLSKALSTHDVDIITTELTPDKSYIEWVKDKPVRANIDIEKLSAEDAVNKYAKDIDCLICSWPPYSPGESGVLTRSIRHLKKLNIDIPIVYIGEEGGGCTDSDDLWDEVDIVSEINIPSWDCIHDNCYILKMTGRTNAK